MCKTAARRAGSAVGKHRPWRVTASRRTISRPQASKALQSPADILQPRESIRAHRKAVGLTEEPPGGVLPTAEPETQEESGRHALEKGTPLVSLGSVFGWTWRQAWLRVGRIGVWRFGATWKLEWSCSSRDQAWCHTSPLALPLPAPWIGKGTGERNRRGSAERDELDSPAHYSTVFCSIPLLPLDTLAHHSTFLRSSILLLSSLPFGHSSPSLYSFRFHSPLLLDTLAHSPSLLLSFTFVLSFTFAPFPSSFRTL